MLVNARLCSQLAAVSDDGGPPEDARAQCVAAAVDAGVSALRPDLDWTADWYKDEVYGQGYVGGTDPERYAGLLAKLGIRLVHIGGVSSSELVTAICVGLQLGRPVLGAIPSAWGLSYAGQDMVNFPHSTHEVCFCDYDAGRKTLTAMNPWPTNGLPSGQAFYQVAPVEWWRERLVYGRVDRLELAGGATAVGFTINGDGTVTFSNGVKLPPGMSAEVRAMGAAAGPQDAPARGEYWIGEDLAVLEWKSGAVWTWRHSRPTVNRLGGVEVAAALSAERTADQQLLDAASATIKQLQAQLAAAQQQAQSVSPAGQAATDALRALAAALAALTGAGPGTATTS